MRFVLFTLLSCLIVEGKRKDPKTWRNLDFNEIEASWTEGDDERELKTEDQLEYDRLMARKANLESSSMHPEELVRQNPEDLRHQSASAGPTMMFAKMNIDSPNPMTKSELEDIAKRWSDLLFTGGIRVTTYVIEKDTVLLTQQHGWDGTMTRDFLLEQDRVLYVEWDSKKYTAADVRAEKKRKRRRRARKKKKRSREEL